MSYRTMHHTEFTSWFKSKAMHHLKQSVDHLNYLIDVQIQLDKLEHNYVTNEIPPDYLEFQIERCLDSFKSSIMFEVKKACFTQTFYTWDTNPIDLPTVLHTGNTLLQKAKLASMAHTIESIPQLAFLDLETDGVNLDTCNILQIAIIKPTVDPNYESLHHLKTFNKYILPFKGYCQQNNKAFHINKIGDQQFKYAPLMQTAAPIIAKLLENTIIVGYNSNQFDIPILKRHLNAYDNQLLHKFSIDLYPACWKDKKQKLPDAIKAYNLNDNPNPHDAEADATCCMDLLCELIERNELPNTECDLIDLYDSKSNTWQHYKTHKVIDINPDHKAYSHLMVTTPPSTLKRKYSKMGTL
jgi:DNA polymerase III epsilon subunit-like protein